jgi:cytochrome b subunit of formate dehydrogenase
MEYLGSFSVLGLFFLSLHFFYECWVVTIVAFGRYLCAYLEFSMGQAYMVRQREFYTWMAHVREDKSRQCVA